VGAVIKIKVKAEVRLFHVGFEPVINFTNLTVNEGFVKGVLFRIGINKNDWYR
jgi:hypothetical protein